MFVIMSDDFENENDGQTDGGALRKQLEKALKDMKALQDQNADLSKQVRSTNVEKLFAEAKADPRGVKFYVGESTKEAVEEWLKADGEPFATAPVKQAESQGEQETGGRTPSQIPVGVTQEQFAAAQKASGMQPTPTTTQSLGDLAAKVGKSTTYTDQDKADIDKLFEGIRDASAALYQERGY